MEYYLVIKVNEVLVLTTTQMDFKRIILGERNQPQNTTCYIIYLCELSRIGKSMGLVGNRSWRWGQDKEGCG